MPIRPENRSLYPGNWQAIRLGILARANDRCEECGVLNHSTADRGGKPVKIILTISHTDHAPRHNDPGNLRALCQACHNRHDAEHRKETRTRTRAAR